MAVGGCFCGRIRIEYSGQPLASVSITHGIHPMDSMLTIANIFPIRHCATVSIVASLPGDPIASISSSKVQNCMFLEVRKKCQRRRIVGMQLRIISVLTVVCIILKLRVDSIMI